MSAKQILTIHNSNDIIITRMKVREAARNAGMDPSDQARISLATSSLLEGLGSEGLGLEGLGLGHDSISLSIAIEQMSDGQNSGLRVVYTFVNPKERQSIHTAAGKIGWMVDKIAINNIGDDRVEIILTKWVMKRQS